ncbi:MULTISPECIES: Pycsar system effector family protein [unclassified Marinobacterium]|uniref:Pycsar system effector family protein n=1 Tax=unclassified Marinobacterium TaxID=2644139 RepID=UPI001568CC76|nr:MULTISPECIES: Pycsar system effector family protein [unclassified Marinobacterium]NRP10373.1 hypothetical protein [Marinobacterium sp. xm-g-48]NRP83472.1 hypothetical protein [Marinobacterium sp. xm-d-509]
MQLKDILSNAHDQLRFAETKHASNLAFNGVLIFGFIRLLLLPGTETSTSILLVTTLAILCCGYSSVTSIRSFFPNTDNTPKKNQTIQGPNLVYFDHLGRLSEDEFLRLYYQKSNICEKEMLEIDKDMANQIIVISQIASNKFRLFSEAVIFTISATLLGSVFLVLIIASRA